MVPFCLMLVLAQAPTPEQPLTDAPAAPILVPAPEGLPPAEVPTQPPPDPKQVPRVWLTGAASLGGSAAAFGLIMLFAQIRTGLPSSGASFDTTFSTGALAGVLATGLGLAVHQALGGRGEPALAGLAAITLMLITAAVVSPARLDPTVSAGLVAGIGAIPTAVAVTAILEATGALGKGRVRGW